MQDVFYIVTNKPFNQPLIGEFLFGQYCLNTESRYFPNDISPDDVAFFSKNIHSVARIFGQHCWVVTSKLKEDLRDIVIAKWRPAKITQPFNFDAVGKDGFALLEDLHREEMQECLRTGKSTYECGFELTTDPDLAYRQFVRRYLVSDFEDVEQRYELIPENATSRAKRTKNVDIVEIDHNHSPPVFSRLTENSTSFFSLTDLHACGLMSLGYGSHALTPACFELVRPHLDSQMFRVVTVDSPNLLER